MQQNLELIPLHRDWRTAGARDRDYNYDDGDDDECVGESVLVISMQPQRKLCDGCSEWRRRSTANHRRTSISTQTITAARRVFDDNDLINIISISVPDLLRVYPSCFADEMILLLGNHSLFL